MCLLTGGDVPFTLVAGSRLINALESDGWKSARGGRAGIDARLTTEDSRASALGENARQI